MGDCLWPVHPQILPDELLSSWMIRLAHGNGFKVHSFYAQFFGRNREIWTRDIDHHAPHWLIDGLSAGAAVPAARIEQATLRAFESYVFARFNEVGTTRWVMPLSVYHRTRRAYGQQFCPVCLVEDVTPYFRREWRLALATICVHHRVLLQDRCAVCGRPLAPHRVDIARGRAWREVSPMLQCGFCNAPLAAPSSPVGLDDLAIQMQINTAIRTGIAYVGDASYYSHLFFDGLRLLIMGSRQMEPTCKRAHTIFERQGARERLRAIRAAFGLLKSWPEEFLKRCASIQHPYTTFTNSRAETPWWLYSVARRELYMEHAGISPGEIAAISAAVKRMTGAVSNAAVRKVSGRDLGQALRLSPIPQDVVDRFTSALDLQIAHASGHRRLLLQRDQAIFILGRHLHMSLPKLLTLEMSEFEQQLLATREGSAIFGSSSVAAIVGKYVRDVRPRLAKEISTDALFITRKGSAIKPNAVGARFQQTLNAVRLTSTVKNWTHWAVTSKFNIS